MSLDIDQIALHQLIKRDEQNLELVLRESLLEPNATVVEMMAELHRVYSAKSKAYGLFNEESELAQALSAVAGVVVSKPMAKKTTFLSGLARAMSKQSAAE